MGQGFLAFQDTIQAGAVQIFHGDVAGVAVGAYIVNTDDVLVMELAENAAFAVEALLHFFLLDNFGVHGFDGHELANLWIVPLVDDTHGATSQNALNVISAKFFDHGQSGFPVV